MITVQSELNVKTSYPLQAPYTWEDIIFFDIETTGLSAKTSYLYLIGCVYYKENKWQITQWLADDISSEEAILNAFLNMIKFYKRLVHFNGSGFDIPFIQQKCNQYRIESPFSFIESFDIYKKILPFKKLLPLSNYKLKTIEKFLGMNREDTFSGVELIQIYANYLGRNQYEKLHQRAMDAHSSDYSSVPQNDLTVSDSQKHVVPSSHELSQLLLLHNLEDVKSLLELSNILYYTDIFEKNPCIYEICGNDFKEESWKLTFQLPDKLPVAISWETPLMQASLKLKVSGNELILQIPFFEGELKYFYDNYKEYYYLPKEDMAVHMSIAGYVDKEYRVKAKASNCYSKKSGCFLPQPECLFSPSFKNEYNDKITYVDNKNPFTEDTAAIYKYTASLCSYIASNKETKIYLDT